MEMTRRQIAALNNPRNLNDNGTLRSTGQPPEDWNSQVAKGGNGSDK